MSGAIIHALAVPLMLHIGGTAIPMKNVFEAIGDLGTGILKHETPAQISLRLGEDLGPIVLTTAGVAVPVAGLAIAGVVLMIKYSKPQSQWTPEERQRWWDQATGVH